MGRNAVIFITMFFRTKSVLREIYHGVVQGILRVEPDPALTTQLPPELGNQTAHRKWLSTARRGISQVEPDLAL